MVSESPVRRGGGSNLERLDMPVQGRDCGHDPTQRPRQEKKEQVWRTSWLCGLVESVYCSEMPRTGSLEPGRISLSQKCGQITVHSC